MRERAELMGGRIVFSTPAEGGTVLHVTVPREKVESRDKDRKIDKDEYDKEDHGVAGG